MPREVYIKPIRKRAPPAMPTTTLVSFPLADPEAYPTPPRLPQLADPTLSSRGPTLTPTMPSSGPSGDALSAELMGSGSDTGNATAAFSWPSDIMLPRC